MFTKTTGFRHTSIDEGAGAIRALGHDHGFTVDTTADAAQVHPEQARPLRRRGLSVDDRNADRRTRPTSSLRALHPRRRRLSSASTPRPTRAGSGRGTSGSSARASSTTSRERRARPLLSRTGRPPRRARCPRTGHAPTSGTSSAPIHARACTCWRASTDVRSHGVSATTEAARCTRQWDIRRPRSVSRTTSPTCSARSRWPLGARGSTVRLSAARAAGALALAGARRLRQRTSHAPSRRPRPRPPHRRPRPRPRRRRRTDPGGTPEPPPAMGDGSSPAINSITVDPGDGTIMVGTGPALFRVDPGAKEGERIAGTVTTPQGSGTVSGNLVLRFTGAGDLLASGHPLAGRPAREPAADPLHRPRRDLEGRGRNGRGRLPRARVRRRHDPRRQRRGARRARQPRRRQDLREEDAAGRCRSTSSSTRATRSTGPSPPSRAPSSRSNGGDSWRPRDTTFGARLDLADEGRALQRRSQRQGPRQQGRRAALGRPRRRRRHPERDRRWTRKMSCCGNRRWEGAKVWRRRPQMGHRRHFALIRQSDGWMSQLNSPSRFASSRRRSRLTSAPNLR